MRAPVHPPETGLGWEARTRIVALALFLMTMALVLGRTGRDTLYVSREDCLTSRKPTLGIASLSMPLAAAVMMLMWGLGVRRARVLATFVGAAALLVYSHVARPGGGPLMTLCFALLPLGFGVLLSMAWLLGADLLGRAPRPLMVRAYARPASMRPCRKGERVLWPSARASNETSKDLQPGSQRRDWNPGSAAL